VERRAVAAQAAEVALLGAARTALDPRGLAVGEFGNAVEEQALALSKVTRFEDDAILAGNAIMLTFTNIGKDIFPRATQATLDLSTAFGMDLQSATMMVGKALNDPIKGLTALGKAGVQFTEDQKEMISAMVEAGDVAGAQTLILAELEKQIGGSAVAAGSTMTGQMEIMKNALGNVKEQIGGALLPVLTEMLNKFGPGFIEMATQFADWFVTKGLPALQSFGQFIELKVYPVLDKFGKWFEVTILPHLINFINFIINDVIPALDTFGKWMDANVFPVLRTLAQLFGETIVNDIQLAKDAFEGMKGVVQGVIDFVMKLVDAVKTALDWLSKLAGAGGGTGAYGGTPNAPVGGGGYGTTPTGGGGGGYNNTNTRGMERGMNVIININAPGGNPRAVAAAANNGVLQAARSLGIA
jgi:phage-related protein